MCDILLFLVCVLVNCPCGEYGLRTLRFQGFLARHISVRSGCRPVCCSFSDGTCNSLPCSTSSVRSCVCEVYECRRLNRGYLLWFSYAVSFDRSVYVRSTNADASIGDTCCGFPMQYRSVGCSSMCMWSCQGRTPQYRRSSTYVKAAGL